jgi:hypothetical protein
MRGLPWKAHPEVKVEGVKDTIRDSAEAGHFSTEAKSKTKAGGTEVGSSCRHVVE